MRHIRGFTLVELMVVVLVAAILAAVAVPSFTRLAAAQRLKTAATNLQSALLVARAEGIKRNANVDLAPASGSDWRSGWNVKDAASGAILGTYPGAPSLTITGPASVRYQSSGRINAASSASFKVSSSSINDVRCITLTVTGVPSVTASGC